MTKARTKGARRRKPARITLPDGEQIEQRHPMSKKPQEPPPIFEARARRCPIDPQSPLNESDIGRCILALAGDDLRDLTGVWHELNAAHRNYRLRIIGQTGEPKIAAAPMLPEPMQTDQSLRVDLRTADERDAAARRVWAEWQHRFRVLPTPNHRWALRGALQGFIGEGRLWDAGQPTDLGIVAVDALRRLLQAGKM